MNSKKIIFFFTSYLLLSHAEATSSNFAVGANFSTLGGGLRGEYKIHDYLVGRLAGNYFSLSAPVNTEDASNIDSEITVTLGSIDGGLNLHLFANGFFLSGGLMHNNNNLTIKVTPTYSIRTKEEIVSVKLRYGFEKLAPYLSVGYSSAFINDGSWHFFAEFGLMYQRQSSISSIITGRLTQVPGLLDHLKKEAGKKINENSPMLTKWWPIVSTGFTYRF